MHDALFYLLTAMILCCYAGTVAHCVNSERGGKTMSNETKWTKGPWEACVLVDDDGKKMSPEAIGQYVTEAIKAGSSQWFSFVLGEKPDGEYDICHVGNGEDSPHNAHLIAAAPELYETLDAAVQQGDRILTGESPEEGEDFRGWFLRAKAVLAKARGETS